MANTFIQSKLQARQIQLKHWTEQLRVLLKHVFQPQAQYLFFFFAEQNAEPQLSPLTVLIQFPPGRQCMNTCYMTANFILWYVVWFSHVHTKVGLLKKSIYVLSLSDGISAAVCRSFSKGYSLIKWVVFTYIFWLFFVRRKDFLIIIWMFWKRPAWDVSS